MKTAAGLHFLDLKIFISMIYRFPWINVCKKPPDPHFFLPIFHFTKKNPPKLLETVGSLSLGRHCCLALPSFFRGWSRSTLWNLVAGWMAGWGMEGRLHGPSWTKKRLVENGHFFHPKKKGQR